MAIQGTLDNSQLITGEQAKYQAEAKKKASTIGKATTDRGTLITKANSEFDKTSFLKMLTAELKNQDPTTDQDSTAYITQMAQFASIEQTYNLNETMTAYAYQGLIGKGITVDVTDNDGNPYTGIVRGVSKENGSWYFSVEVNENGENVYKVFDASKLNSVIEVPDYTNTNMLVNSDFIVASNLASDENNKVVIVTSNDNSEKKVVKGTVKSAFLDNGVVKVRVQEFDEDGNLSEGTKDYLYTSIYKGGQLTDKDMDVKASDFNNVDDSSDSDTLSDPNSSSYDKSAAMNRLVNSTVDPVRTNAKNTKEDSAVKDDMEKLEEIVNS